MTLDLTGIRSQFPSLNRPAVFFDNPGGTQIAQQSLARINNYLLECNANHEGAFATSIASDAILDQAHQAMADFYNATSPEEIVFGNNMTTLTFHVSRSISRDWQAGEEILVTRLDHDANVSPWVLAAQERGITVRWLPFNRESWRIEPEDLVALLSSKTRLLALNYASNMTGSINPVETLIRHAKQAGALVYVDAVQFTPHGPVDVRALGCDFLACSSYKFFGPHLGILWGRPELLAELFPYAVRCASRSLPARHEIGTPQTELIAGLEAAVQHFEWLGTATGGTGDRRSLILAAYRAMLAYELPLMTRLIDGLRSLPGVSVRGIADPARFSSRVPTVSFTHSLHRSGSLAEALGKRKFCVWSGHNYAYEAAQWLGLDADDGVLRIGLAHYNTIAEVTGVLQAIEELIK